MIEFISFSFNRFYLRATLSIGAFFTFTLIFSSLSFAAPSLSSSNICLPPELDTLSVLDLILSDSDKISTLPWVEKANLWRTRHQQLVQTRQYTGESAAKELIDLFGFDPRLEPLLSAIDKKTKTLSERLNYYQANPEQFKNFAPSSTTNDQRKKIYNQIYDDLVADFSEKNKTASKKTVPKTPENSSEKTKSKLNEKSIREAYLSEAHTLAEKFSGYIQSVIPKKNPLSDREQILKLLDEIPNTVPARWKDDHFKLNQHIFSKFIIQNRDIETAIKLAFGSTNPNDWNKLNKDGMWPHDFQKGKTTRVGKIIEDNTTKTIAIHSTDFLDGADKTPVRQIEMLVGMDLKKSPKLSADPVARAIQSRAQKMIISGKVTLSGHFLRRMQERNFTLPEVFSLLENYKTIICEYGNRFSLSDGNGTKLVVEIKGASENEFNFITIMTK